MSEGKKRFLRVGASGVAATVVDVVALLVFVELWHLHVTPAAFVAAALGAVTSFCANKFWAFQDRTPTDLSQVGSFLLVALGSAMALAAGVHLFAALLHVPYLAAKALSAFLVFALWSYPAQARFVFTKPALVER